MGLCCEQPNLTRQPCACKRVNFLAGGIAGAVSRTCTAPLDRVKIYQQVRGSNQIGLKVTLQHLYADGGLLAFWRGNGVSVLKIMPESATKFTIFHELRKYTSNPGLEFASGSVAGVFAASVVYPLEVIKTRLNLRRTHEPGKISFIMKDIYSSRGLKGFYRGYMTSIMGTVPYAGIELSVYEAVKMRLNVDLAAPGSTPRLVLCAAISSLLGIVTVYPLAILKSRLQSRGEEPLIV